MPSRSAPTNSLKSPIETKYIFDIIYTIECKFEIQSNPKTRAERGLAELEMLSYRMNEESFIRKLSASLVQGPDVAIGPGDDCAALDFGLEELILAAADQVVSGVHYLEAETTPEEAAGKLLNRNISDIAAMGGRPTHALVTIALNPVDEKWLESFHKGLQERAASYGISIVGGDISSLNSPGQACSLTILGRAKREKLCLRSNAKAGDILFGTGLFGNSFASGKHLLFKPRLEEAQFLAGRFTNAMIDVSDGLLKDARRMTEASNLALTLDLTRIPLAEGANLEAALTEGEDYELLFSVKDSLATELEHLWPFKELPITRLGCFKEGVRGDVSDGNGNKIQTNICGFDHFHGNDNH